MSRILCSLLNPQSALSLVAIKWYVCGRLKSETYPNMSKSYSPRTSDRFLAWQRTLQRIQLRTLRRGDCPGLSEWAYCLNYLYKEGAGQSESKERLMQLTGAQIGGMHSEDAEEATSQGRNQKKEGSQGRNQSPERSSLQFLHHDFSPVKPY